MRLKLKRYLYTDTTTIGILDIEGQVFCRTLEDTARPFGIKIPKKTCIYPGEYRIILDDSTRFKRLMPHILSVPYFEGVRIHSGNTSEDTEGCVLVGFKLSNNSIFESKLAFEQLFNKLKEASDRKEEICIEIVNGPQ